VVKNNPVIRDRKKVKNRVKMWQKNPNSFEFIRKNPNFSKFVLKLAPAGVYKPFFKKTSRK
jgi:hypothetical protein